MAISKELKRLLVIALLATALTVPVVLKAGAQEVKDPVDEEATTVSVDTEAEVEIAYEEEPVEEVVEEDPVVVDVEVPIDDVEEVVEETEEPVESEDEVDVAVDIAEAIQIAEAEHSGVEVVMAKVKLKNLDDEKVYKVVFEDGWRIYVRASDGEIVRIKDDVNQKHDCSKRGQAAVQSWRNEFKKRRQQFEDKQSNWRNERRQNDGRRSGNVKVEGSVSYSRHHSR